jgi:anti-sigma factor RsiW
MNTCNFRDLLMPYHDGELPERKRAELEAHLRDCPECAAELTRYRALSSLLGVEHAPGMPVGMLRRLHAAVRPVREYEIMRTCRWAAAVAATLLVAAIGWLARSNAYAGGAVQSPAIWEVAAVTLNPDLTETASRDAFAQWVAGDLSRGDPE